MKKGVLSKVLAVVLAAAVLCGTGFTAVGQFVGTDVFVSADEVYGDFDFLQIHKKIRQGNDPCHYAVMNAGGGTRTHTPLRATDFESASSANSDTPAHLI